MRFLLGIPWLVVALALPVSLRGADNTDNAAPLAIAPPARSSVDIFRELLEMKPGEREQALAKKKPEARKVIEERLKEFDALSPELRQRRLRLMQLQWELHALLPAPPATRQLFMQIVPEQDRPLIEHRLAMWDKLSPDVQKLVLENEMVMCTFITGRVTPLGDVTNNGSRPSPPVPTNMLTNIDHWRHLTPDQQRQAYDAFYEIFGLADKERDKVFESLQGQSANGRDQIENFLKSIGALPVSEREKRMVAFQKFSSMTLEQRMRFLENAQRWQAMPEKDRDAVRKLLKNAPPIPPLPLSFLLAPNAATNAATQ